MTNVHRPYRGRLQAVIFDWAGTTVDYGSLAPIRVLQKIFADRGVEITERKLAVTWAFLRAITSALCSVFLA